MKMGLHWLIGSFEMMSIFWKLRVLVGDEKMLTVLVDATRMI